MTITFQLDGQEFIALNGGPDYRVRRALGKSGRDLLSGFGTQYQERDSVEDMTGLMMEFSSTHGTALYAQLRKAVKASSQITHLRGSALVLEPGATAVGALVDGNTYVHTTI